MPPTSHPIPLANVLRADEPVPCLDRDAVLSMAPAAEDGRFRVPRVLGEDAVSDLTGRTAAELAAMVRSGDVSAVEVTDAHLERIEALDGEVRSFLCVGGRDGAGGGGGGRRRPGPGRGARPAGRRAGGGQGHVLHH